MGKPFLACMSGKLIAGIPHNVQSVQKEGSPVASSPFGAGAGSGRCDNCVVALFEKFKQAFVNRIDPRQRPLIINRPHFQSLLDLLAQLFRETISPRIVLTLQIQRHFGAHDRLVLLPRLGCGRKELDLFQPVTQMFD